MRTRTALLAVLFAAVPAPAALASPAQVTGATLQFAAAPGAPHGAFVDDIAPGGVQIRDNAGAAITPGAGCGAVNQSTVQCSGATSLDISTGDGNDLVDLGRQRSGGTKLPATIDLGPGDDTFNAN